MIENYFSKVNLRQNDINIKWFELYQCQTFSINVVDIMNFGAYQIFGRITNKIRFGQFLGEKRSVRTKNVTFITIRITTRKDVMCLWMTMNALFVPFLWCKM